MKPKHFLTKNLAGLSAAIATFVVALSPSTAAAAAAGATGIDASFVTMLDDLTGMLGGNFGALVLLVSLIIGVAVYAVSANWRYVLSSVMIAFLIGYGIDIIQGIGGVTATVDMLTTAHLPAVPLDSVGSV